MQSTIKKILIPSNIVNILLSILPISFIAGNLAINLNIVIIIIFTISVYRENILSINLNLVDKLLIVLFLFSFLTGFINSITFSENSNFIFNMAILKKSFFFSRYLLFYFIIRFLIDKGIFNFKYFFVSASFFSLFVALDLILQLLAGKDIFGYLKSPRNLSGPFGDEYIAGSYLQRYSIFIFFLIPFIFKDRNKKYLLLVLSIFFILVFFSMLVAGNRMPIILFVLMFVFLFLIEKKLRKYSLIFIFFSTILFIFFFNISFQVEDYTRHFLDRFYELIYFIFEIIFQRKDPMMTNTYIKEFYTGYAAWMENPIFGGGINSFYFNCLKNYGACSTHPHNYYLEILSEIGLVGFILLMFIFFKILQMCINSKNDFSYDFNKNLMTPFLLIFLVEIFPLKSTGSFFTTGNASFIFFIIAILISLSKKSQNN